MINQIEMDHIKKYIIITKTSSNDYLAMDSFSNYYVLAKCIKVTELEYCSQISCDQILSNHKSIVTPIEFIQYQNAQKFAVFPIIKQQLLWIGDINSLAYKSQFFCVTLLYGMVNYVCKNLIKMKCKSLRYIEIQNIWLQNKNIVFLWHPRSNFEKFQVEELAVQRLQRTMLHKLSQILKPLFHLQYNNHTQKTFLCLLMEAMSRQQLRFDKFNQLMDDKKQRRIFMQKKWGVDSSYYHQQLWNSRKQPRTIKQTYKNNLNMSPVSQNNVPPALTRRRNSFTSIFHQCKSISKNKSRNNLNQNKQYPVPHRSLDRSKQKAKSTSIDLYRRSKHNQSLQINKITQNIKQKALRKYNEHNHQVIGNNQLQKDNKIKQYSERTRLIVQYTNGKLKNINDSRKNNDGLSKINEQEILRKDYIQKNKQKGIQKQNKLNKQEPINHIYQQILTHHYQSQQRKLSENLHQEDNLSLKFQTEDHNDNDNEQIQENIKTHQDLDNFDEYKNEIPLKLSKNQYKRIKVPKIVKKCKLLIADIDYDEDQIEEINLIDKIVRKDSPNNQKILKYQNIKNSNNSVEKQVTQYLYMINKMGEAVAKASKIASKIGDIQWFPGAYFVYKRFWNEKKNIEKWLKNNEHKITRYPQEVDPSEWKKWFKDQHNKNLIQKAESENLNILDAITKMNIKLKKNNISDYLLFYAQLNRQSKQQSNIVVFEIIQEFNLLKENGMLHDEQILTHISQLLNSLYIIGELDGKIIEKKSLMSIFRVKNLKEVEQLASFISSIYLSEFQLQ